MTARAISRVIVCGVVIAASGSAALGESVGWVGGESFGGDWSIWSDDGPDFDETDTIYFSGPLEGVYGNSCEAEMYAGGELSLGVDQAAHEVEIYFEPPAPFACPAVYLPVCGLSGDFGALEAGDWTFFSTTSPFVVNFSMSFTVWGGPKLGDIDGDGDVDLDDFVILKEEFGTGPPRHRADFDDDGDVDLDDFLLCTGMCMDCCDADGDGDADLDDFIILKEEFGTPPPRHRADVDDDGDVDLDDFAILKNDFGTAAPLTGSGQAVPEPATMTLLVLSGLVTMRRRGR